MIQQKTRKKFCFNFFVSESDAKVIQENADREKNFFRILSLHFWIPFSTIPRWQKKVRVRRFFAAQGVFSNSTSRVDFFRQKNRKKFAFY
jgi:hypothetical protein